MWDIALLSWPHSIGWTGGSPQVLLYADPSSAPRHTKNLIAGPMYQKMVKHLQGGSLHTTARGMAVHAPRPRPHPLVASGFSLKSCWDEIFQAGTVQVTHRLLEGSYGGGGSQLPLPNTQP